MAGIKQMLVRCIWWIFDLVCEEFQIGPYAAKKEQIFIGTADQLPKAIELHPDEFEIYTRDCE